MFGCFITSRLFSNTKYPLMLEKQRSSMTKLFNASGRKFGIKINCSQGTTIKQWYDRSYLYNLYPLFRQDWTYVRLLTVSKLFDAGLFVIWLKSNSILCTRVSEVLNLYHCLFNFMAINYVFRQVFHARARLKEAALIVFIRYIESDFMC